jgi:limonene-1,2-epoxide hydrolase
MITKEKVKEIIEIYSEAWKNQGVEQILTIFTKDAKYQEGFLSEPMVGHEEIRKYWNKKVVLEQKSIQFKLVRIMIDGNDCLVEWHAEFDDLVSGEHVKMVEVAFLEFLGDMVSSLRENWDTIRIPIAQKIV